MKLSEALHVLQSALMTHGDQELAEAVVFGPYPAITDMHVRPDPYSFDGRLVLWVHTEQATKGV